MKKLLTVLLVVLTVFAFSACGKGEEGADDPSQGTENGQSAENSGSGEGMDNENNGKSDLVEIETLKERGAVFVGWSDSRVFEAQLKGSDNKDKTAVFMVPDGIKEKVDKLDLQDGSRIDISYYISEDGQNIVQHIDVKK